MIYQCWCRNTVSRGNNTGCFYSSGDIHNPIIPLTLMFYKRDSETDNTLKISTYEGHLTAVGKIIQLILVNCKGAHNSKFELMAANINQTYQYIF